MKAKATNYNEAFFILNELDKTWAALLCVKTDGTTYRYVNARLHRECGHMESYKATPLKTFGFDVEHKGFVYQFVQRRESAATYSDGGTRHWQGSSEFGLRLPVSLSAGVRKHATTLQEAQQ